LRAASEKFFTLPMEICDLYLDEPDSGGASSDDHYKITVKIHKTDADNIKILETAIEAFYQNLQPQGASEDLTSPLVDGVNFVDNNPDLASYFVVTFKSLEQPSLQPTESDITIGDLVRVETQCAFDNSGKAHLKLHRIDKCYPLSHGSSDVFKLLGTDEQALLEAYYTAPENIRSAIRAMLNLVD
jgi:hypothetical protein